METIWQQRAISTQTSFGREMIILQCLQVYPDTQTVILHVGRTRYKRTKPATLNRRLEEKGARLESVVRSVIRFPELLDYIVAGLESDQATVRFNSSKVLLATAQESPETLLPQLRAVVKLLDSDNKILRAAAIRTLGYVSPVDSHGQITRVLGKILKSIAGPDLVVASSAIEGAALVAGQSLS